MFGLSLTDESRTRGFIRSPTEKDYSWCNIASLTMSGTVNYTNNHRKQRPIAKLEIYSFAVP